MKTSSRHVAVLVGSVAPVSLMLGVGCAAAPPCPAAEPVVSKPSAPPAAEPPPAAPLTTNVPAELRGEFALITGSDKERTVDFAALAKSGGAGEFTVGFTADGVALSAWQLTQQTSSKDPNHTVYSLCRGRVTVQPSWRGMTMVLPFKIDVTGFSDALDQQSRRDGDKVTTTRITSSGSCTFSLGAGEYVVEIVASDSRTPSKLRLLHPEGRFELDRTAPVTDLEIKTVIEGLKAK